LLQRRHGDPNPAGPTVPVTDKHSFPGAESDGVPNEPQALDQPASPDISAQGLLEGPEANLPQAPQP